MTDVFSKKKRSEIMSRIRSKWTKQEVMVHNYLKGHKIRHKMHPKIDGNPDIILKDSKVAIFLHGCFWHRCPNHYKEPKSKKKFWRDKIKRNVARDKRDVKTLKKHGWKVIVVWEHETKDIKTVLSKISS